METSTWIARVTDESIREIAKRTGISERTLHHQVSNNRMSLENIIKISVTYDHHPLTALIEWGFIEEKWAAVPDIAAALRMASEDQLGDEVLRRMKIGVGTLGDKTVDELVEERGATIHHLPTDEDLDAAIEEANAGLGAAQERTDELTEPDTP